MTFHAADPDRTTVTVRIEVDRRGAAAVLPGLSGVARRVVRSELAHFKEFIEGLGQEAGGWRGTIRNGHVQPVGSEPARGHVPRWPVG